MLSVSLTQKVSLFQGAAVFLDGQAGWPVPTDPDRQNWKSGISWVMRSCTFFRNFANRHAVDAQNVWPTAHVFEDTDFVRGRRVLLRGRMLGA